MYVGRPRLLSNYDIVRASGLRSQGYTYKQLAQLFDVSRRTIWRALKKRYRQPERCW